MCIVIEKVNLKKIAGSVLYRNRLWLMCEKLLVQQQGCKWIREK